LPPGVIALIDDSENPWVQLRHDLSRQEVIVLLGKPIAVTLVHCGYGTPLRVVDAEDRWVVWRNEIEPNFVDRPDEQPARAPGQLPYNALLYQRAGQQLLLFDCLD
jgi:hypothetical protein